MSEKALWLTVLLLGSVILAIAAAWPRVRHGPPVQAPAWAAGIREGRLSSEYCVSCHKEAGSQWRDSLHHLANAPLTKARPGADFQGGLVKTSAAEYRFALDEHSLPLIEERRRDGSVHRHRPSMVIAHQTLRQFLIETKPGSFQTIETAWDPNKHEWFSAFGPEERNPGEWGHWTGQSMNWNSMCARCHMTVYNKGYEESSGSYHSSWVEHGVGCVQCHGPMTGHESGGKALEGVQKISKDPALMAQTCAACHARAEDLTHSFPPGSVFEDHFRLQLMTDPRFYRSDGQILDEVFEWGSFRHSRMGAAGVTCLDCHNPHTGKTRLPADDNSLCMQCHAEGNTRKAPVINPTGHSFHKPDSKGNRCVECHMAETVYMQRDPRRDHGFIIPDPRLNKELGIPDACSRCHADKTVDWNLEAWENWYGTSGKTALRRERTRAVARAQAGDRMVVPDLLRLAGQEATPGWKASLLGLAGQLAPGDASVAAFAVGLRSHTDPLLRAAAVRALAEHAPSRALVRQSLQDSVRLVRLDAALALTTEIEQGSLLRAELDEYQGSMIEHPISLLRRGQDRFLRGLVAEGVSDLHQAIRLDPLSSPLPEALGFMLNSTGRPEEAARQFEKAATLAPSDPRPPYYAALAWVEAGDPAKAENLLQETLRREPGFSRAWYNLGLLQNQSGRSGQALATFAAAEQAGVRDADIPYASATLLLQAGRLQEAAAAARRALAMAPEHEGARSVLRQLGDLAP